MDVGALAAARGDDVVAGPGRTARAPAPMPPFAPVIKATAPRAVCVVMTRSRQRNARRIPIGCPVVRRTCARPSCVSARPRATAPAAARAELREAGGCPPRELCRTLPSRGWRGRCARVQSAAEPVGLAFKSHRRTAGARDQARSSGPRRGARKRDGESFLTGQRPRGRRPEKMMR